MSAPPTIASIVEGYGEVSALPVLVRRIALEVFGCATVELSKPHRVPRNQMVGPTMCRAVEMQTARIANEGGVLVVADADDDDPSELATQIEDAAKREGVLVAIAVREYEAWFLAAIESLRTHRSVRDDAHFEGDPELPRGAKSRLESQMVEKYRETIHQPAFSAMLSIEQAQRCLSFDKLVRQIGRLLDA
ncbi:DUF4276 family protein [Micromonospora thermarum]|uniref:DUF4276 family protein n=1 Tax=Micromonospora thermarum TaxID=2720024 RepID=A0ABX0ZCW6_9ACTN|nr:DUF4276 family protein [Micromonospora thermarum]NJP34111.1 DUF4276 family protein [Micromonospora thermarum]